MKSGQRNKCCVCFAAKKPRAQAVLHCPRGIVDSLFVTKSNPHQPHRIHLGASADLDQIWINKVLLVYR